MSEFKDALSSQLTTLRKKQRELELISEALEAVQTVISKESEHKDIAEKVGKAFQGFANQIIQGVSQPIRTIGYMAPVENSQPLPPSQPGNEIAQLEDSAIKNAKPAGNVQDMIKFAMAYRHLENAKVKVGEQEGTVTGLLAPNLVVTFANGNRQEVSPTSITVIQQAQRKQK